MDGVVCLWKQHMNVITMESCVSQATCAINSECKKLGIYENAARKLAKYVFFSALTRNNGLSLMTHIFGSGAIHSMTK